MFSKRIFLKGIDYFQLLIDHHSKIKGGNGHEARLAMYLQGKPDKEKIKEAIQQNEICTRLAQVRINKTFGLGYPSLIFKKNKAAIPIAFWSVNENEIPESLLNIQVNVYRDAPLHLQVIYLGNGNTCLLFTFHHILFDFAGVQSLIQSLAGYKNIPLLPVVNLKRSFIKRFDAFFEAIFFTFREANSRMTVLGKPLPEKKPFTSEFREVNFSIDETKKIYENCLTAGIPLSHSNFFLAAVCRSMHINIFQKQKDHQFIWVPVPVNVRKKGVADAVLFNGLSFLFYKLKPGELENINTIISSLNKQMKIQMHKEMPEAFIDFADGYRFMPMPLYYSMLQLPSMGKLSSFSFSVLGKTFTNLTKFLNHDIIEIKNFPSNSTSPGITFLFYEFRNELKLMTSWVKGQYTNAEQDEVLEKIREVLLNNSEYK